MKTNINKLVKKVLTEQGVKGGASDETAVKMKNQQLKMAYQAGCFPWADENNNVYNLNGEEVWIKQNSTKVPGFPYAVLRAPVQGQDNGVLEYYSDNQLKTKNPTTRTWTCAKLRKLQEDSMNQELINFVNSVREANPDLKIFTYGDEKVNKSDKVNGVCTLTKLSDFITATEELSTRTDIKSLIPTNTDTFIWVCKQTSRSSEMKSEIGNYTTPEEEGGLGYSACTGQQIDFVKKGGTSILSVTIGNTMYCKSVGDNFKTLAENMITNAKTVTSSEVKSKEFKKACQNLLKQYYDFAYGNYPINYYTLSRIKPGVNKCASYTQDIGNIFGSKKWEDLKTDINNLGIRKNEYGQAIDFRVGSGSGQQKTTVFENRDSILKKIIRENLNELSESKKKSLVEEYNIINTRFKIISESGKPKTKKQKEKFVDDLLSEMFYLKSQGFNDILINEQFLDIIKSFFGQVPGGIFDTIKERFVQLILEKLGIGTEGYLANIFIATIGDIPIGDYANGKIFNCEYLSNAISKGVGEGIARKIQKEQGMEGYLYDIIRNSLVDMFTDSSFGQKIEGAIADLVCPSISKIKDKMDLAGETMKEKALS